MICAEKLEVQSHHSSAVQSVRQSVRLSASQDSSSIDASVQRIAANDASVGRPT